PPFGADGVDHFLFDSREGYSEYFGSAMTVLMRSVDIPARMTTGYTTGNLIDGSNLYLVSDRHSHGWAEVYFPGYGWIPFEPTPGREIPVVIPPEEQAAMAALRTNSDGSGDLPCEIEEDCEEADISLSADDIPVPEDRTTLLWNAVRAALPWVIAIGAVLMILAVSAWTVWRWLLATPANAASTYRRLRRLGRFASLAPAQHQTPHQWAATVLQALPEQRAEVLRIVDAYVLSTYSGRASDESSACNHVADAWRSVRLPLLWYALRRREA
ncbi:MAG: transglutaminase domain-containing protein, partial [Chloroflexi bacterium]|nr:transglutaminase domain-containing protein [Chloroflexota bacterium]